MIDIQDKMLNSWSRSHSYKSVEWEEWQPSASLPFLFAEWSRYVFITMKRSTWYSFKNPSIDINNSKRFINPFNRYVAITPSAIPLMTRTFYFEKGDIRVFNYKKKLFTKKPEAKAPFFFKIKSTHLCLSLRYFQKPAQFYDMFANSEKFIKRLNLN